MQQVRNWLGLIHSHWLVYKQARDLQRLLLRVMIASTTLVVSVSAYTSYQVVRNLILESLKHDAFLQVQQGVNNIDRWLAIRQAEIATLADTDLLRSLNWPAIEPSLQAKTQQNQEYFCFVLINSDGSSYNTLLGSGKKFINLKNRKYFQKAIAGQANISDPLIGVARKIPLIVVAAPIWTSANHQIPSRGVLAGSVSITRVTQVVSKLKFGKDSYAFALNSQGEAIVHPNTQLMLTLKHRGQSLLKVADRNLVAIAQRMVKKQQAIELVNIDGTQKYVAFAPLEQANWSVALVIPRQNIESQLLPLNLIALVVLGLGFTMIAVLWQVHSFEQAELKKSKILADLAKEASDTANKAKSTFLTNMSHELRTPLNGILGYAQILYRAKTWGEQERRGIEIIYNCGTHLLTLINDILDLSKIEAEKMELYPTTLHFPAFLQGVVEMCLIRAQQKGIEFIYLPTNLLPEGVRADDKRLRQVLVNLLGNAIKFTDKGKVTFKVDVIDNNERLSMNRIRFQVEDTGIGMSPDVLEKIFAPFEQVGDHQNLAQGTGLGLTICQQIVELMGSCIQVESQLGIGSIFSFEIDFPLDVNWTKSSSTIISQGIIGYKGERKTILIADDKWENRSVIVNLLEPLGFKIIQAENGQEALEKILEVKPDLIITDLAMPVIDGYSLMRNLRKVEEFKQIGIIVSSASVSEMDRRQSLDAGGDDFLAKPVQSEELFKVISQQLLIDWEYESDILDTHKVNINHPDTDISKLIAPAAEVLVDMLQLAQQGDMEKLVTVARKIAESNQQYVDFIAQILLLAETYEAEKIEELIQKYL